MPNILDDRNKLMQKSLERARKSEPLKASDGSQGVLLAHPKICNCCGANHTHRPLEATIQALEDMMIWWNCNCGSTMLAYAEKKQ